MIWDHSLSVAWGNMQLISIAAFDEPLQLNFNIILIRSLRTKLTSGAQPSLLGEVAHAFPVVVEQTEPKLDGEISFLFITLHDRFEVSEGLLQLT